jgi:hypothetical protein
MGFLPLYVFFIALSLIISISVYFVPKANRSYLKFFPPFLITTLIVESLGSYLWSIGKNNLTLYNFFTAFEFWFYLWLISMIIDNSRMKRIIRTCGVLYVIVASGNIIFVQGLKTFHTVTYSLGCLLVVIFCIYYFLELFRLPKSMKLKNNPAFWISSGLLFFYCCGFPLYGLVNYWENISPLILKNFDNIITILNVFLYSLFTIAFLCQIRTRNFTLSQ